MTKDKIMEKKLFIILFFTFFQFDVSSADTAIDVKGFSSHIQAKLSEFGYLKELNEKYQIRATQVSIEPKGYMKDHHHAGPGIRCITSGELTYIINNQTHIYKEGDCYTETGDISHISLNNGLAPVKLLNFELLPSQLEDSKTSLIPLPTPTHK